MSRRSGRDVGRRAFGTSIPACSNWSVVSKWPIMRSPCPSPWARRSAIRRPRTH